MPSPMADGRSCSALWLLLLPLLALFACSPTPRVRVHLANTAAAAAASSSSLFSSSSPPSSPSSSSVFSSPSSPSSLSAPLGRRLKGKGSRRARSRRRANATSSRPLAALCARADEIPPPPACRRPPPCDLRALDPGARFNRHVVHGRYGRERKWAKHNVDPASRHLQNGVDWWVHRALPPPPPAHAPPPPAHARVFVAAYFSYLFLFAPHLAEPALRAAREAAGGAWREAPHRFFVAHGHPGSCVRGTAAVWRLVVDAALSCQDSQRTIAVPYVVSRPTWLVAPTLPPSERTTLLFFRGHLPRSSIDTKNVRRLLLQRLAGQPGVVIEAATAMANASYQPHSAYLRRMLSSVFCLAARGDTPSSRRTYEAIAAGCIPVIIADELVLPFSRRLRWETFSVRFSEQLALSKPLELVRSLREMPPARLAQMQAALLEARPHFLWHLDPTRPSAVDQILQDMCTV